MIKFSLTYFFLFGCTMSANDTFNSRELVSTKGEKVYINTLNWGITDDYQISCISKNPDKVKSREDTLGTIRGLEPFIYSFKNDSLKLFFKNEVLYTVHDHLNTIVVRSFVLNTKEYTALRQKAFKNEEYYSVPMKSNILHSSDMPKPPSN